MVAGCDYTFGNCYRVVIDNPGHRGDDLGLWWCGKEGHRGRAACFKDSWCVHTQSSLSGRNVKKEGHIVWNEEIPSRSLRKLWPDGQGTGNAGLPHREGNEDSLSLSLSVSVVSLSRSRFSLAGLELTM